MRLDIHIHHHTENVEISDLLKSINYKLTTIMAKQSEMATDIRTVIAQIQKISTESAATLQKVADLEAALANQENVSPELQSAFDDLKAQVQKVDDLVPDAPVVTDQPSETPATGTDQPVQ